MTILEYLKQYELISNSINPLDSDLTEKAHYLGYTTINALVEDIENTCLIDYKSKNIIPAYRYLNNPVGVVGDSISDALTFRVYNDINITNGIDLTANNFIPEILWQNNTNNLQGIFQITVSDDVEKNKKIVEGNVITFKWVIEPQALYRSGELEFSVRFVNYIDNEINYNLATQSVKLNIETGLNYISTMNEGDYNIISTFSNPYINTINTYIIDGGNIDE